MLRLASILAVLVGACAFLYSQFAARDDQFLFQPVTGKNNTVLLVVDHQEGLFQLARDQIPSAFKSSILAHAALAKVFNLPTVLTTSADSGKSLENILVRPMPTS